MFQSAVCLALMAWAAKNCLFNCYSPMELWNANPLALRARESKDVSDVDCTCPWLDLRSWRVHGAHVCPPTQKCSGHIIVVCIPADSAVRPESALSPTGLALGLLMLWSPS